MIFCLMLFTVECFVRSILLSTNHITTCTIDFTVFLNDLLILKCSLCLMGFFYSCMNGSFQIRNMILEFLVVQQVMLWKISSVQTSLLWMMCSEECGPYDGFSPDALKCCPLHNRVPVFWHWWNAFDPEHRRADCTVHVIFEFCFPTVALLILHIFFIRFWY